MITIIVTVITIITTITIITIITSITTITTIIILAITCMVQGLGLKFGIWTAGGQCFGFDVSCRC